jgi:hypothetical protein
MEGSELETTLFQAASAIRHIQQYAEFNGMTPLVLGRTRGSL